MTSETKTGKFNKKILAAIIIIIVAVASVAAAAIYVIQKPSTANLPSMTLTVVGADGQQKVLNENDIAALQSYTANGGFKSSGGLMLNVVMAKNSFIEKGLETGKEVWLKFKDNIVKTIE